MSSAPAMVASDADRSNQRKSDTNPEAIPSAILPSIRFARNGPWNEFDVRDTRTRILNSANDTAIRLVRTPAIRTAYASVPIRWMTNVRVQMTKSWVSMLV
jgi:hypothetical protein